MTATNNLQTAITATQAIIDAVSGIRAAPEYAPNSVLEYPFSVAMPDSGTFESDPPGVMKGLHSIHIELHCAPRKDLAKGIEASMPYGPRVAMALLNDPTLGGTVSTFARISYTFGSLTWGDPNTVVNLGWSFTLDGVKIQEIMTT